MSKLLCRVMYITFCRNGHSGVKLHSLRIWQTIRSATFARHGHERAYAAIVLSGGYEEAGDHGRFRVGIGDVVLHERFEAHINRFSGLGATVLNLPLSDRYAFLPGSASIADPDFVIRIAEKNKAEAAELLLSTATVQQTGFADWPDELAAALMENPSLSLSLWGANRGLTPWAISRGFMQVFGLSPSAFRARTRARHAWKAIETSGEPLSQIAAHLGFADQSHMTRSVKQLTGVGSQAWRTAANRFKTQ
jgi:AraC-like DNA-binding protein